MQNLQTPTLLCPNCHVERDQASSECARCGIVFAKYRPLTRRESCARDIESPHPSTRAEFFRALWDEVKRLALTVEGPVNPLVFGGRAIVFVVLVVWGWKLATATIASNYVGESFMHLINLPFHEAGHIFFTPLGRFLQVLGGSLGQVIMPMVCVGALLVQQRNPFGAAVALWWVGESLLDLAPYINDARALDLMLIGGVTGKDVEDYHDWEYILRNLGWLQYDHVLAVIAHHVGTGVMTGALVWAGWLLMQQSKRLE